MNYKSSAVIFIQHLEQYFNWFIVDKWADQGHINQYQCYILHINAYEQDNNSILNNLGVALLRKLSGRWS